MSSDNKFSNQSLISVLFKWKYPLFIVFALAVIFSALFSSPYFITPKYKSFAVIYPSNLIPYSTETATEQMLQIFKSDDIRDSLIAEFNLIEYYDIDVTKEHYFTTLIRMYEKNVNIRKTEFESVYIEILDWDAVRASEMVKEMINLFNRKVRQMHREKAEEVLVIASNQLQTKERQIDSVSQLINKMSTAYHILDFETQAKEVTRGYLRTVDGAGATHVNNRAVLELKQNLEEKGSKYILLNNVLEGLIEQYIELKTKYEVAVRDVEKHLTYTNVVSSPVPADKKSYPIRWLIVFVATLAAMFLSVILIMTIENYRKYFKS